MKSWFFIGVDLGQVRDYTAISIVERRETAGEFDHTVWAHKKKVELLLRYLERIPLGTPYPEVVDSVVSLTEEAELAGRCSLVVDATGVGKPVVDLLRRARPAAAIVPVVITGGETASLDKGTHKVPKKDLVTEMLVMLEAGELGIAGGLEEGETLVAEMVAMRGRFTASGREQFMATSVHDDLVLASALACWMIRRVAPVALSGENAYCRVESELAWRETFERCIYWFSQKR